MNRIYNVTIEYLGLKKQDKFPQSTICLGKDGAFLVMDEEGNGVRFVAQDCRVEQIAAHVIIVRGFTDKPRHVTAYCIYANRVSGCLPRNRGTPMPETTTSETTTSGQAYARPDGSALDGYRACAGLIRCALDKAANERPRRRSFKMHRLAAYREGYHAGLLFAHCQLALGEFPLQNADAIKKALEALNAPAHLPPASGGKVAPVVGTSGGAA